MQVVEGTVAANSEQSSTDGTSVSDAADSMSKTGADSTSRTETDTSESEESASELAKTTNVTTSKRYTVRKGDTLANISLSLYDSRDYVDTICEINDIENPDVIYEGMVLELP